METVLKYIWAAAAGILSLLAPIRGLIICALIFVTIDFATGVAASYKRSRRNGIRWSFESAKAWNTVSKTTFIMAGILLSWMIDTHILAFMNLRLANLFTGFACGVEFWSYLENAAEISQHPVFRWLKRFMKSKLDGALGSGKEKEE